MSCSTVKRRKSVAGVCGVCGNFAKCFHFGGLSCDGCKSFFRRCVRKASYTGFICEKGGNCTDFRTDRKYCRRCRFNRCRANGMDPNWVMNETDRARLKYVRTVVARIPESVLVHETISFEEHECIERLIKNFKDVVVTTPVTLLETSKPGKWEDVQYMSIVVSGTLRVLKFLNTLPGFCNLSKSDGEVLYFAGVKQASLLRSVFGFDHKRMAWPHERTIESLNVYPPVSLQIAEKSWSPALMQMMMQTITKVHDMHIDEPCVILIMLIILFSPERSGLVETRKVEEVQEQMATILRKYVRWRYGGTAGSTYAKLLTMIADIQEFSDQENEMNLFLDESQVEILNTYLGDLNPYTAYTLRDISHEMAHCNNELDGLLNDMECILPISESSTDSDGICSDESGFTDLYDLLDNLGDLF